MRFLLFGRFVHRDRGKSQSISRRIGPVSHRSSWPVTFPRFTIRSSISAKGRHVASHNNQSAGYERIARFHLSQLAYLPVSFSGRQSSTGYRSRFSDAAWNDEIQ